MLVLILVLILIKCTVHPRTGYEDPEVE